MLVDLTFDNGIMAYMIIATILVLLLIPGFAFFYGGLNERKNYSDILLQNFAALSVSIILWFICGYSLCFSGDELGGFIGDFNRIFMLGVGMNFAYYANHAMPESVFIAYQMVFSVLAPVIISAVFFNRFTLKAFLIFIILWQLLINYPVTHIIWCGGLFQKWGVLDFAGGLLIHVTAGFTALAAMIFTLKIKENDSTPNSIPLMAMGGTMLWLGWLGLNTGRVMGVANVTPYIILNTLLAAGFAAFTWFVIEWNLLKKPSLGGIFKGALAGLISISAGAGFVALQYAIVIGVASGFVCFIAVFMKRKFGWDDAFEIWGLHGMGGIVGMLLTGIFAEKVLNENGIDGLLLGNSAFFVKQCVAVVSFSIYAFVVSYVLLAILNKVMNIKKEETIEQTLISIPIEENADGDNV